MCPGLNKDIVDIQYHFKPKEGKSGEITIGGKTVSIDPNKTEVIIQRFFYEGIPRDPVKIYVRNGSSTLYDITNEDFKTHLEILMNSKLLKLEKRLVTKYNC